MTLTNITNTEKEVVQFLNKDISIWPNVNLLYQLVNSDLFTMSNIFRYSWASVLKQENLAEHSYYVTVLSDLLATDIKQKNPTKNIDQALVMKYALYHDYSETFIGDIITPVKYKSSVLKKELDRIEKELLVEGTNLNFFQNEHIAKRIQNSIKEYEKDKNTVIENRIVKFSDTLQSLIYITKELNLGNVYMKPIFERVLKSMIKTYSRSHIFKPYIEDLLDLIERGELLQRNLFNINWSEYKEDLVTED